MTVRFKSRLVTQLAPPSTTPMAPASGSPVFNSPIALRFPEELAVLPARMGLHAFPTMPNEEGVLVVAKELLRPLPLPTTPAGAIAWDAKFLDNHGEGGGTWVSNQNWFLFQIVTTDGSQQQGFEFPLVENDANAPRLRFFLFFERMD